MNEERADEIKNWGAWKKPSFLIWLLFGVVIAGLLHTAWPRKEPVYGGKPLSYWLARYWDARGFDFVSTTRDPTNLECRAAIRGIGTNAIPVLLDMLRAKDSALKMQWMEVVERQDFVHFRFSTAQHQYDLATMGFFTLADLATSSVPALVDIYKKSLSGSSKESADYVLKAIYPASGTAVPYWVPPQHWAQWYFETGQLKYRMDARSNAILALSQGIKLDSTNVPAFLVRAAARYELDDFAGALSDATASIHLDNSNQVGYRIKGVSEVALNDFTNAEADLTLAINLDTNDASAYNDRGLARANLRKLDDALADFNTAAGLIPEEATCYRNRALVEFLQKEYELALEDINKSIGLAAKDPAGFLMRGRIKSVLKEYKSALAEFDKAIELNPNDPAAYVARGSTKMYMDDFASASVDLEKALQLNPKTVAACVARGCLKAKRGGADGAALADLEHAVELAPQQAQPHAVLGLFEYKFLQWAPALENCRKALDLGALGGADDLRAYIWLIRAQTDEEADASKELEQHLKSLKGDKRDEWGASIARFLSGSLPESDFLAQATTTAKRPSAVRGQICESLYYAGMKRKLAGDKSGALKLFQQCLATKDDNNFGYMNADMELHSLESK